MTPTSLLADLLADRPALRPADVQAWWGVHEEVSGEVPFDGGVRAAARFDRLGWAFASGYQAALYQLVPDLRGPAALAATEAGGAHPRAIATRLVAEGEGWRVSGDKAFVTLGSAAEELLVLAVAGERDGRRDLVMVRVSAASPGVIRKEAPAVPFVPEIPHDAVVLDQVTVPPEAVLPGDGWADWVRPFRTVEDLHVFGALLGFLVGNGLRAGWAHPVIERAVALLVGCRSLALADAGAPAVHVALAGLIADAAALVDEVEPLWAQAPPDVAEAFARDRALLQVAGRARDKRLRRAWERLGRA